MTDYHWTPDTFWNATFLEVHHAVNRVGQDVRSTWESAGWLGLLIYNLNVGKKDRKKRVSQLIKFPWDLDQSRSEVDQKKIIEELKRNTSWIEKRFNVKFKYQDE